MREICEFYNILISQKHSSRHSQLLQVKHMLIVYQTVVLIVLLLVKGPLVRLMRRDKGEEQNRRSVASFVSKISRWDQVQFHS